jgi:putative lipoic acid-binding regulatory protein
MSEESALEFPCEFPIKMMGYNTVEFRKLARTLVENHAGPVTDDAVQLSLSRNDRFVSVTVTIRATSQQQLDDIYRDVSSRAEVLMAL